jgi:hypothetical protein
VLHLWKPGSEAALAADMIAAQLAGGDTITVVVLDGAPPSTPATVSVRRLGADLTYRELVDLVFDAEHVVPW